jgi:hypothetical protein
MNRTEELTLSWLDGTATMQEQAELMSLVNASEQNARIHDSLVRVEKALCSGGGARDLSAQILLQIEKAQAPKPTTVKRRARPTRTLGAAAVGALLFVGAAYAFFARSSHKTSGTAENPAFVQALPSQQTPRPVASSQLPSPQAPAQQAGKTTQQRPFASATVTSSAPSTAKALFAEDFENSPKLPKFVNGIVAQNPEPNGSQFSAQATLSQYEGAMVVTVQFDSFGKKLVWDKDAVIAFDYWLGGTEDLAVQMWIPSRNQNFLV